MASPLRTLRPVLSLAAITMGETSRQPTTWVLTLAGGALILMMPLITLFALGNERSLFLHSAQATIGLVGVIVALIAATGVITREIESRTIVVLLSKPIRRAEVVVGKYLGILGTCLWVTLVLGVFLLLATWLYHASAPPRGSIHYREPFVEAVQERAPDAYTTRQLRARGVDSGDWWHGTTAACLNVTQVEGPFLLAGVYLLFWQTALIAAVVVTGSCVFSTTANAVMGFALFGVGHLVPWFRAILGQAHVAWMTWLMPNLDSYDLGAILWQDVDAAIPGGLLWSATLSGVVFTVAALALGCFFLSRRDFS